MGYCTCQDLETYFLNKSFKCGDYLSTGKANDFIATDAAIIDSALKTRYTLPLTNTNDLMILKMINEKMVVGTIDDIFREKGEDGKFNRGRDTRKEALDYLKQIKDGTMILEGNSTASVIKFNSVDSQGNVVDKRFKVSNIEPNTEYTNRETRTVIRES